MAEEKKIELLKDAIIELRRRYGLINDVYKSSQLKMFTFIGAGFGLLTYLYSGKDLSEFYFIPKETYGIILYVISLFLILGAMVRLFVSLRGFYWEYPCHIVKLKEIEESRNQIYVYKYLRDEYIRAVNLNQKVFDSIHKTINDSSLMLVCGGMLVLLIKIFNE